MRYTVHWFLGGWTGLDWVQMTATLELFSDPDDDAAWHGGCLGLAELCRRGLLLPERLGEVVPLVSLAMHFDVPRGQHR